MQFLVELLRNTCPLDRRVGLRLACAIQIPLIGVFGYLERGIGAPLGFITRMRVDSRGGAKPQWDVGVSPLSASILKF